MSIELNASASRSSYSKYVLVWWRSLCPAEVGHCFVVWMFISIALLTDGGQVDIINRSPKQIQQDVVLVKVSARVFVRTHMCKKQEHMPYVGTTWQLTKQQIDVYICSANKRSQGTTYMHEKEHLHIFTFILCIHTYVYLTYPVVHHLYSCFLLHRIHMQCKHQAVWSPKTILENDS